MHHTPFTARNVAKYAVTAIIAAKVEDTAENAIIEHTSHEEDELIVTLGSHVIGWGVASAVKPHTDKIVDKTANFIAAKRQARKDKKNADTTE